MAVDSNLVEYSKEWWEAQWQVPPDIVKVLWEIGALDYCLRLSKTGYTYLLQSKKLAFHNIVTPHSLTSMMYLKLSKYSKYPYYINSNSTGKNKATLMLSSDEDVVMLQLLEFNLNSWLNYIDVKI